MHFISVAVADYIKHSLLPIKILLSSYFVENPSPVIVITVPPSIDPYLGETS